MQAGAPSDAKVGKAKLGFIGGGRMAQAMAARLVAINPPEFSPIIHFHDPSPLATRDFSRNVQDSRAEPNNQAVCRASDIVLLAVKPAVVESAFERLAGSLDGRLVISVAAGVTLERLQRLAGHDRVIRTMPNTPALIGKGITAIAPGKGVSEADWKLTEVIFSSIGSFERVSESQLDAVTGLSGSGPAYVFLMIEALADGGVMMGLPRDLALRLAIQTVAGAAELAQASDLHPAQLREQVTSPGGTTARGLQALEHGAVRYHVQAAVEAATLRSEVLSGKAPAHR